MTDRPDFHRADSLPCQASELMAFRRNVARLHDLGDRALYELLLELARDLGPRRAPWLLKRIEAYAAIDRGVVAALGGSEIPKPPLRVVR